MEKKNRKCTETEEIPSYQQLHVNNWMRISARKKAHKIDFCIIFALVKEFARHIEVLLLDNDCVIVPGFGGFVAHRVSARRVEEENLFLPPYRTIGFNPAMKLNDGLLVQSYMVAYDASYPEAVRLVEAKVLELERVLQADGEYELHGIGKLRQNIEGQYSFLPLESGILSPVLYGMSSFELLTLDEIAKREEEERMTREAAIAAAKKPELVLEPSFISDPEHVADEHSHRRERFINIAAACIAIVLTCLLALPFTNIGKSSSELVSQTFSETMTKDYRSIVTKVIDALSAGSNTPKVEVVSPSSSTKKRISSKPKAELRKEVKKEDVAALDTIQNVVKEEASVETPAKVAENHHAPYYTIVLASQVSQKNAEIFIEKLNKREGLQAEILKDKFTRVVYSKFKTMEEAYQKWGELKDIPEFKNSWIKEVK